MIEYRITIWIKAKDDSTAKNLSLAIRSVLELAEDIKHSSTTYDSEYEVQAEIEEEEYLRGKE